MGHADDAAAALVKVADTLEQRLGAAVQQSAEALQEVHQGLDQAGNAYLAEWAGPAQGITNKMIEAGQQAMAMAAQLRDRAAHIAAGS